MAPQSRRPGAWPASPFLVRVCKKFISPESSSLVRFFPSAGRDIVVSDAAREVAWRCGHQGKDEERASRGRSALARGAMDSKRGSACLSGVARLSSLDRVGRHARARSDARLALDARRHGRVGVRHGDDVRRRCTPLGHVGRNVRGPRPQWMAVVLGISVLVTPCRSEAG